MLPDPRIPRYYRIRYLTLLGGTLGDWQEAYSCYVKAEIIWRITKQWHCDGKDPVVNRALDNGHEGLNDLKCVRSVLCVRHALITHIKASLD
jgi:hypothetical protein